jgi:succinoglycan biosynthesis protein ExoA
MAEEPVVYFPRCSLWNLGRQYVRNGAGRARTIKLHRMRPKLRQVMPLLVVTANVSGLVLMRESLWFGLPMLLYVLCCLAWGTVASVRVRDAWLLAMGLAAISMHMAWAVGFIRCWIG